MTSLNYGWYPTYEVVSAEAFVIYVFLSIVIETIVLAAFIYSRKEDAKIKELSVTFLFCAIVVANLVSGFIGYFMAMKGL